MKKQTNKKIITEFNTRVWKYANKNSEMPHLSESFTKATFDLVVYRNSFTHVHIACPYISI